MSGYLQLQSILFSMIYGMTVCILYKIIKLFINKKSVLLELVVNSIFVIDVVCIYIYSIYRLNHGYFHIYFLATFLFGAYIINREDANLKMLCKKIVKIKKKARHS